MNQLVEDSFDDVFKDKQRVMVVTAHPDDNEVICGGTVARLIASGRQVRLVVVTNGEKGTEDQTIQASQFAKIRIAEQMAAGIALGIPESENFNLGIPDGELEASVENIGKIARHIREFKPDLVISHNPEPFVCTFSEAEGVRWINHRDHRHSAQIAVDAVYPYSRDRGFFPQHFKDGLEPHIVTEMLWSDSYTHPQRLYFDITEFNGLKRAALEACPSVIPPDHVTEYVEETKIGDRYYEQLRYLSNLY